MCHAGHTIFVEPNAVAGHRGKGDTLGACGRHDDNASGGDDNDEAGEGG